MTSTIQKRVLKNYIVGIVSFAITLLQSIITVPILLNYWGNDIYGIWIALFAGFTLLQSFDLGHQSYVGNLLNVFYHTDKSKFSSYLGSSLLVAGSIGILQLIFTITLIITGYLNNFLGISGEAISYSVLSYSMIALIIMSILTSTFGGILVRMLIPAGYMTQNLVWGLIFKLSQFISLIIVAFLGGQILIASIVYSIVQTILAFSVFSYIRKKMPEFYPWWKLRNVQEGITNLKKSTVLTINNLLQQLSNNGLVLFISNIFSTAMVPAFTTVRTLTNTATVFTNLFITSTQPDLIKYHAKKESAKLNSTLNAHWFFSGLVVNTGLILVIPYVETIFRIWTKGMINFDFKLFITLAASISALNFGAGLYNYLFGINNLRALTTISVARVIFLFAFSFFLGPKFGLVGVGIGVLVSEIISSILMPYFFVQKTLKTFQDKLGLRESIIALLAPLIIFSLCILILCDININYFIWATAVILNFSVYLLNWQLLDDDIKQRFSDLINNVFKIVK